MKKHCTLLAFVALLFGGVAPAHAQSEMAANLSGDQEAPIPVTTIAFGQATFDVNFSENTLGMNYTLSATNLKQAFMAHIHCGATGVSGPVIVQLAGAAPGNRGFNLNGPWIGSAELTDGNVVGGINCTTATGGTLTVQNLIDVITLMATGMAYVNIHTTANPGGEIRGQIQLVAPFTIP